jgi:hypothetical protein
MPPVEISAKRRRRRTFFSSPVRLARHFAGSKSAAARCRNAPSNSLFFQDF